MAGYAVSPGATEFVGEKDIDVEITIRVIGRARIHIDGTLKVMRRAEIDYCIAKMDDAIDNALLPLLEKAVGFKHVVLEGKTIPSGCAMLSFRRMLYEDAPLLRECIERDKKKKDRQ